MVEQSVEQRVDSRENIGPVRTPFLHQSRQVAGIDDQDIAAAHAHKGQTVDRKSKNMVQRQWAERDHFPFWQYRRQPGPDLLHIGNQVAVGQHAAFRHTRGSAGVLQDNGVIRARLEGLDGKIPALCQSISKSHRIG